MNKKPIVLITAWLVLLTAGILSFNPLMAQEEGGFKETFDDPTLPQWERAREVVVADGVLRMNPGSFALRFGDWSDITLTIRVRYSGEGVVAVSYYFRDEGKYGVLLEGGRVVLEREQNQSPTLLGSAEVPAIQQNTWIDLKVEVSGDQHQIYVNDELQVSANDSAVLDGAILLQVHGEATAEFDDLEVRGVAVGPRPPGEGQPATEPLPGQEPIPPGEEPVPLPQAGQVPPAVEAIATPGPGVTATGTASLINEFFASQAANVELTTFAINLILAAICAFVLGLVYIHWGASLSNRRKFAANFMMMTVTTTFIILVVRSSVALSLGLVGALSIVRFRTAVKEAEELAYLFFAIGLGIGLGDNQRLITLLALAAGIVIIGLVRLFRRAQADVNLHLVVASHNPHKIELEQIMGALQAHTTKLKLLRFDENLESLEASFLVEFTRLSDLNGARAALKALSESVEITFLDNRGIW